MTTKIDAIFAYGLTLTLSLAGLFTAVGTQLLMGLQPCAWCVIQRMCLLGVSSVSLAGLIARALKKPTWPFASTGALICILGALAAGWQWGYASHMATCTQSMADRFILWTALDLKFPTLFEVRAACADASSPLLGIPYPAWSLTLFLGLLVLFFCSTKLSASQKQN